VAYNFQIGNKKIKMLTDYENLTQKVFVTYRINTTQCSTTSPYAPFIFREQLYFVVSGLKNLGFGNGDSNLESHIMNGNEILPLEIN
jgi:hypothetical protein